MPSAPARAGQGPGFPAWLAALQRLLTQERAAYGDLAGAYSQDTCPSLTQVLYGLRRQARDSADIRAQEQARVEARLGQLERQLERARAGVAVRRAGGGSISAGREGAASPLRPMLLSLEQGLSAARETWESTRAILEGLEEEARSEIRLANALLANAAGGMGDAPADAVAAFRPGVSSGPNGLGVQSARGVLGGPGVALPSGSSAEASAKRPARSLSSGQQKQPYSLTLLEEEMERLGGPTGGWPERDHDVFYGKWLNSRGRPDRKAFVAELVLLLPQYTPAALLAHDMFCERYASLAERHRRIIKNWRERRDSEARGLLQSQEGSKREGNAKSTLPRDRRSQGKATDGSSAEEARARANFQRALAEQKAMHREDLRSRAVQERREKRRQAALRAKETQELRRRFIQRNEELFAKQRRMVEQRRAEEAEGVALYQELNGIGWELRREPDVTGGEGRGGGGGREGGATSTPASAPASAPISESTSPQSMRLADPYATRKAGRGRGSTSPTRPATASAASRVRRHLRPPSAALLEHINTSLEKYAQKQRAREDLQRAREEQAREALDSLARRAAPASARRIAMEAARGGTDDRLLAPTAAQKQRESEVAEIRKYRRELEELGAIGDRDVPRAGKFGGVDVGFAPFAVVPISGTRQVPAWLK